MIHNKVPNDAQGLLVQNGISETFLYKKFKPANLETFDTGVFVSAVS